MKILAFTDTHSNWKIYKELKKKSKHSEMIISCGDLTTMGLDLKKILKYLSTFNKPIFFVHGNHDPLEEIEEIIEKNNLKNLHLIHKNGIYFKDLYLFGYGGGGFSARDPDEKEYLFKQAKKLVRNHKRKIKNILVTHAPPFKTKLDKLPSKNYCGNKDLKSFLLKNYVDYFFCGHIHENEKETDKLGKTFLTNPGYKGLFYEL